MDEGFVGRASLLRQTPARVWISWASALAAGFHIVAFLRPRFALRTTLLVGGFAAG